MLQKLQVKNFALIREIEINFSGGLTTITGETGAGKSILLGALSLVLGQRADQQQVNDKTRKCIIEAIFNVSNNALKAWFLQHDLDYSNQIILRREITPSGSSRAFINDTPVVLQTMRELGLQLIDIHSQHETLRMNSAAFQLGVLDNFAGNEDLLAAYRQKYTHWKALKDQLELLITEQSELRLEQDFREFQYNELAAAGLVPGEVEQAESELSVLSHAGEIRDAMQQISVLLDEDETGILARLGEVRQAFRSASGHPEAKKLSDRVESVLIELKDITTESQHLAESVTADPERLEYLNNRLSTLNLLLQKHRVSTVEELIQLRDELDNLLRKTTRSDHDIAGLKEKINDAESKMLTVGNKLTAARKKAASKLPQVILSRLHELGMPQAELDIRLDTSASGPDGLDRVEFLFSANKGVSPGLLSKIASGGELSRLMFCIKLLSGSSENIQPVLIFDEIDTGVSGEVAGKLGKMMAEMAAVRQVICITHLPQVASKGSQHLYVYKETQGANTWSFVRSLQTDERIDELARMLSGEKVSAAAVDNARQLLAEAGIV